MPCAEKHTDNNCDEGEGKGDAKNRNGCSYLISFQVMHRQLFQNIQGLHPLYDLSVTDLNDTIGFFGDL